MKVKSESEVAQSCPTLRYHMDCSLPGSSVHGIFQARVLEWGAITFSAETPGRHVKVIINMEWEEELKSFLMKVKEESEKVDLKLNIQKTKIMVFGPITSWEIDGQRVETVSDFIFLGSKITGDGDCSHESKRRLLLGRKVMTSLDSIFPEKAMAIHSSTLGWQIPWTEEPGWLQSMAS